MTGKPRMLLAAARRLTLLAAALAACGGVARPGTGGQGRPGRLAGVMGAASSRDDIIVLPQLNAISAIAVSRRFVFAATPNGLAIYDRNFRAWRPPVSISDGIGQSLLTAGAAAGAAAYDVDRAGSMAADPGSDAVWIGGQGVVYRYDPTVDVLDRVLLPRGGTVDLIAFDRRDLAGGALVRASGYWSRVTSTGFGRPVGIEEFPPAEALIVPAGYEEIVREYPALRSFGRLMTRDGDLRSWPVSDASKPYGASEVWLGTWGNGVFEADPLFLDAEHHPFGLVTTGAGAIASDGAGIWVAGSGAQPIGFRQPERGGLTFTTADLADWRWVDPAAARTLDRVRAYDIVLRDGQAWVATGRGLFVIAVSPDVSLRDIELIPVPSDAVFALASAGTGIWVGTASGVSLQMFGPDRKRDRAETALRDVMIPGVPVRDLLLVGESLWIASDRGLMVLPGGRDEPLRPVAPGAAILSRPIRALAHSDSIVTVATEGEIRLLDARTATPLPTPLAIDAGRVGEIETVAMDGRTIWIGGSHGLLIITRATRVARFLPSSEAVHDVELAGDIAWVASHRALVRFRRLADGTIP